METAINLIMILVSALLILIILLQGKGSSFSGTFGTDSSAIHKTRRGIEKTLFQFTVIWGVVFVVAAIFSSFIN